MTWLFYRKYELANAYVEVAALNIKGYHHIWAANIVCMDMTLASLCILIIRQISIIIT